MAVCYLEIDDEVTGAIARLRAVADGEAIVVVPSGSRIATSRINFKLLAREASERGLRMVAVSDEPAVRALAVSAEVPAFESIAAAERALSGLREQEKQLAQRTGPGRSRGARRPPGANDDAQLTLTLAGQSPAAASPGAEPERRSRVADFVVPRGAQAATRAAAGAPRGDASASPGNAPADAGRSGRRAARRARVSIAPLVAAAVLLLVIAAAGYGALVLLPTATITLRPATTELRPAPFTVLADPNVAVVDAAAGVIPAQWLDVPLSTAGQFASTGIATRETRATGVVRFRSENTLNDVAIADGTVVSTRSGIEFETTESAVVPRADFATSTPGQVDVAVRARQPGPAGNVGADAIVDLPGALRGQLVSVRNPEATMGGRRLEQRVVSAADYEAALAALTAQLTASVAPRLGDPAVVPRGLTAYPESARITQVQAAPAADALVDTEAETFTLELSGSAMVMAVNEALVDEVGEVRLRALVPLGQQIVAGTLAVARSAGAVTGDAISFEATSSARIFAAPDAPALLAAVRGKSISEARQILSAYGMVEIAIWPEFIDRLPDQTARINLVVATPSPLP